MNAPLPPAGHRVLRPLLLIALAGVGPSVWLARAKPGKAETRELKREMAADASTARPAKRDDAAGGGGPRTAADAGERNLARLREYLEVTDDAEWAVILERINRVTELRRNQWSGGAGGRGGVALAEKGTKKSGRSSAHPEQEALRAAVGAKLPDAEIRARLSRAHEVYQENEARLARAQADLRAVLTVRQEAVAVMAGLLPP